MSHRIHRATASLLPAILPAALLCLAPHPVAAVPTISGQVLNAATSNGIVGIDLDVFDAATGLPVIVTGADSGTNGTYTITLPAAGSYLVRADPDLASGFIDEFHNNAFLKSQATPLVLGANTALTGINFTLSIGRTISGKVTSGGNNVDGIDMDVFASTGEFISGAVGLSAGGGNYTVGALPPGNYFVRADPDPALGQLYVETFFGGTPDILLATPITLAGANLTNKDIAMPSGGVIAGTVVSAAGGAPLTDIDFDVYNLAGVRQPFTAASAVDGTYLFGALPAGQYLLRADPTIAQAHGRVYWNAAASLATATPITVNLGATTSNVNFVLPAAGSIAGTITRASNGATLPNIDLDCYDSQGVRVDITTRSAANGTFAIGPLPVGSYFLRADPAPTDGYLLEYYPNVRELASASAIAVGAGAATANIDFALEAGGWVSGLVRAGATPLADIDLDIYDSATGVRVPRGDKTNPDGTYVVGPLAPGSYKLRCDPLPAQHYAVEYYNAKSRIADADALVVAPGTGTAGIDFQLDAGASIAGIVRRAANNAPVANIDVDVFDATTGVRFDQSAKTAVDGTFTIGPLAAGQYKLRADVPAGIPYLDRYWPDAASLATATPIAVGADVSGIVLLLPDAVQAGTYWTLR